MLNSSGAPERAVPLFAEALSLAECNGDDVLRRRRRAHAGHRGAGRRAPRLEPEGAGDGRAQRPTPAPGAGSRSLYNNIGQTYLERGDYARGARLLPQGAARARGARRRRRRARRALDDRARRSARSAQLDDAEAIQRALLAEYDRLGETDGYVYEELAEIALARGDAAGGAAVGREGARGAEGRPRPAGRPSPRASRGSRRSRPATPPPPRRSR